MSVISAHWQSGATREEFLNFPGAGILKGSGKPMWFENAHSILRCPFIFREDPPIHVIIKAKKEGHSGLCPRRAVPASVTQP